MMKSEDHQIGFISYHNLDKANDFYFLTIACFVGIMVGAMHLWHARSGQSLRAAHVLDGLDDLIEVRFFELSLLLSLFFLFQRYGLTLPITLVLAGMATLFFSGMWSKGRQAALNLVGRLLLVLTLAIYSMQIVTNGAVAITIMVVALILGTYRDKNAVFLFTLIILFKFNPIGGTDVVSDAFHYAELFVATTFFESFFSVFPNIGYIEEICTKGPLWLFAALTDGVVEPSFQASRTISKAVIYGALCLWISSNRNILVLALVIMALPDDRCAYLLAMLVTLIGYAPMKWESASGLEIDWTTAILQKTRLASQFLLPLYCLLFSPIFSLVFVCFFLVRGMFIKTPKTLFKYFALNTILAIPLTAHIFIYLSTYAGLLGASFEGGALPMVEPDSDLNRTRAFGIILLTAAISSMVMFELKAKQFRYALALSLFGFMVFYLLKSYGFTRIDNSWSRIEAILMCSPILVWMASLFASKRRNAIAVTAMCLFAVFQFQPYQNFIRWQSPATSDWVFNQQRYILAENLKQEVARLRRITSDQKVIFYTHQVALADMVPGSYLPTMTSPYVTLGRSAQELVLNVFARAPNTPIYFGNSLMTFDNSDIRARTPLVFKTLKENGYKLLEIHLDGQNFYFGYPSTSPWAHLDQFSINEVEMFSGFDLGKALQYYNGRNSAGSFQEIKVSCKGDKVSPRKFKLQFENNWYFAELNCGVSELPNTWSLGEFQASEPI